MNIPDWVAEYVDEVNNGYRFSVYISQGLDVSNLTELNEWLVRDGFKPLEEDRHKALLNLYKEKLLLKP